MRYEITETPNQRIERELNEKIDRLQAAFEARSNKQEKKIEHLLSVIQNMAEELRSADTFDDLGRFLSTPEWPEELQPPKPSTAPPSEQSKLGMAILRQWKDFKDAQKQSEEQMREASKRVRELQMDSYLKRNVPEYPSACGEGTLPCPFCTDAYVSYSSKRDHDGYTYSVACSNSECCKFTGKVVHIVS